MMRMLLRAAAILTLSACADAAPTAPSAAEARQARIPDPSTQAISTIFTTQTPASTLDATGGWEVGTRFFSTQAGCITGFRYWRAVGETGTPSFKLWSSAGSQLFVATFSPSGSGGWQTMNLSGQVCLSAYTYYTVSVNTNSKQVKTFGAFDGGPIGNGPLVATSGYYGQPIHSVPTTQTNSNFFVDILFSY